jgi:hypothetical protein
MNFGEEMKQPYCYAIAFGNPPQRNFPELNSTKNSSASQTFSGFSPQMNFR